jgi:hypothetical protein
MRWRGSRAQDGRMVQCKRGTKERIWYLVCVKEEVKERAKAPARRLYFAASAAVQPCILRNRHVLPPFFIVTPSFVQIHFMYQVLASVPDLLYRSAWLGSDAPSVAQLHASTACTSNSKSSPNFHCSTTPTPTYSQQAAVLPTCHPPFVRGVRSELSLSLLCSSAFPLTPV